MSKIGLDRRCEICGERPASYLRANSLGMWACLCSECCPDPESAAGIADPGAGWLILFGVLGFVGVAAAVVFLLT